MTPTTPGWYECRFNHSDPSVRLVRYWDGEKLLCPINLDDYTDFRPLVPQVAIDIEPVRVAHQMLLDKINSEPVHARDDHDNCRVCGAEKLLAMWLSGKPRLVQPTPQPAVRCFAAESGSQWAMTNETEGVYFSPQGGCWPTSYTAENLVERPQEITYTDALARLADRPEQQRRLREMGE